MLHIQIPEQDAVLLRETLTARLNDLRREESHTDSPRYRASLYDVDGALERLLAQLEHATQAQPPVTPLA